MTPLTKPRLEHDALRCRHAATIRRHGKGHDSALRHLQRLRRIRTAPVHQEAGFCPYGLASREGEAVTRELFACPSVMADVTTRQPHPGPGVERHLRRPACFAAPSLQVRGGISRPLGRGRPPSPSRRLREMSWRCLATSSLSPVGVLTSFGSRFAPPVLGSSDGEVVSRSPSGPFRAVKALSNSHSKARVATRADGGVNCRRVPMGCRP